MPIQGLKYPMLQLPGCQRAQGQGSPHAKEFNSAQLFSARFTLIPGEIIQRNTSEMKVI